MRQALKLHPDPLCFAATHIEVDVARPRAGSLMLCYFVTGKINDLAMPPVVAPCAPMSFGGTPASRHSSAAPRVPAITNSTLRPRPNGQPIGSAVTGAGCVLRPRSARPGLQCNRVPSATLCEPRWNWISCRACHAMRHVASRSFGGYRRDEWPQSYWALAHPPGKPDFHHSDCFAHRSFRQRADHEIWHRPPDRRTRVARAAQRQACCIARASGFGHGGSDAFA